MKQDVKECKKWMARGTSDDSAKKSKVNTLQSEKREKSKESNEHQNSFKRPKDLPNLQKVREEVKAKKSPEKMTPFAKQAFNELPL